MGDEVVVIQRTLVVAEVEGFAGLEEVDLEIKIEFFLPLPDKGVVPFQADITDRIAFFVEDRLSPREVEQPGFEAYEIVFEFVLIPPPPHRCVADGMAQPGAAIDVRSVAVEVKVRAR